MKVVEVLTGQCTVSNVLPCIDIGVSTLPKNEPAEMYRGYKQQYFSSKELCSQKSFQGFTSIIATSAKQKKN